ncbi:hypothetical protein CGRA01v4_08601 [Colletotrichum graminicola]|nr:hypothetical protein CGRA01v4_08601 [Colletotrichum graminicola]
MRGGEGARSGRGSVFPTCQSKAKGSPHVAPYLGHAVGPGAVRVYMVESSSKLQGRPPAAGL